MMCYVCWKEFKGWCKSFTRTEVLLAILEALLLIILIGFLIFLVLHLIVCASWVSKVQPNPAFDNGSLEEIPSPPSPYKTTRKPSKIDQPRTTLHPNVKCTWEPSKKTDAVAHYYEGGYTKATSSAEELLFVLNDSTKTKFNDGSTRPRTFGSQQDEVFESNVDSLANDDQSDGEEADHLYKSSLLGVVKLRPPRDVTFGCAAAAVSEHWALTAASCLEAIEEIDSLDNFLLMERYGEVRSGRTHTIADVQVHPLYQGANRSYDVAALRSEDSLRPTVTPLSLPTLVDHFLITVGERFSILGFGSFRTVEAGVAERGVRAVGVYSLPGAACREGGEGAEGGDTWAPRHLARGRQDGRAAGTCRATPLCAGVRYARGQACTYCGGTPLVREGVLLGVMAATRACAVACEPALYVSVALVRDWLDMLLEPGRR